MLDKLNNLRNPTRTLLFAMLLSCLFGCENNRMTRYSDPVIITINLEESSIVKQIESSPERQSVSKTIGDYTFLIVANTTLMLLGSDTGIPIPTSLDMHLCKISGVNSKQKYLLDWGRNSFVTESELLDGKWVITFDAPRIHKTSKPFTFTKGKNRIVLEAELNEGVIPSPDHTTLE